MKVHAFSKSARDNNTKALSKKIIKLKQEKNAVILAHYYQEEAIQKLLIIWVIAFI